MIVIFKRAAREPAHNNRGPLKKMDTHSVGGFYWQEEYRLTKYLSIKTQQYIQLCKAATCFGYSNHHQADISVHGHDVFSDTVRDPILFTFVV